ncbi:MAG TPA: signal peptidase II [Fibrobacteria bacterium]|nr:signal peptidase II [Fibrobacteria bacterium]
MIRKFSSFRAHAAIFMLMLVADQLTKWWARARFSLPNGEPDYSAHIAVLGDWFHLRLVYNHGAAFGLRPHEILPFLHPMSFYVAFSLIAIVLLSLYYRRLGRGEPAARLGIALILSGAVGNNLIDRLMMHKVTDLFDVGIPGVDPRWPVFNIADSAVSIGLALLIIPPFFARSTPDARPENTATQKTSASRSDVAAPGSDQT